MGDGQGPPALEAQKQAQRMTNAEACFLGDCWDLKIPHWLACCNCGRDPVNGMGSLQNKRGGVRLDTGGGLKATLFL